MNELMSPYIRKGMCLEEVIWTRNIKNMGIICMRLSFEIVSPENPNVTYKHLLHKIPQELGIRNHFHTNDTEFIKAITDAIDKAFGKK